MLLFTVDYIYSRGSIENVGHKREHYLTSVISGKAAILDKGFQLEDNMSINSHCGQASARCNPPNLSYWPY